MTGPGLAFKVNIRVGMDGLLLGLGGYDWGYKTRTGIAVKKSRVCVSVRNS